MSKTKKKISLLIIFLVIIFSVIIWLINPLFNQNQAKSNNVPLNNQLTQNQLDSVRKRDSAFIKASTVSSDSNENVIRVSNPEDLNVDYQIDKKAGTVIKRIYNGRRINIAIVGVDSRLGSGCKHADANHILSILIDKGEIEITSIPRDTPAEADMPDSSGQNKLTIVYSHLGPEAYLKEAARIAGLDKIQYYAEVGFSQAIGIIDFLGFKDPRSTLQVLRSRTALGGDDYQRCYNQGQFIRQMLLRNFNKTTGLLGEIFIRGGLALFNTNLTYDFSKNIIQKLQSKGFPNSPDAITVRVRPPIPLNYKIYDFSNQTVVTNLKKKIEYFNKSYLQKDSLDTLQSKKPTYNAAPRLMGAIKQSIKDSAKYSKRVIQNLKLIFDQRAWMQCNNKKDKESIRDQICILLSNAYSKNKNFKKAQEVRDIIEAEKKLFATPH